MATKPAFLGLKKQDFQLQPSWPPCLSAAIFVGGGFPEVTGWEWSRLKENGHFWSEWPLSPKTLKRGNSFFTPIELPPFARPGRWAESRGIPACRRKLGF
jgi:hypothetical protein